MLSGSQAAERKGADGVAGGVEREGPLEARGGRDEPGDRCKHDLTEHGGGLDPLLAATSSSSLTRVGSSTLTEVPNAGVAGSAALSAS